MFRRKEKKTRELSVYEIYVNRVWNYLERNKEYFLEEWSKVCAKTSGRVPYEDLKEILGPNYPKAPWLDPSDDKANITALFAALSIPCRADDTHIYFP